MRWMRQAAAKTMTMTTKTTERKKNEWNKGIVREIIVAHLKYELL